MPSSVNRAGDFDLIQEQAGGQLRFSSNQAILIEGDSLNVLRSIPTHSISLILTDPPYHVTKKANIVNDTAFEHDSAYLDWISSYAAEWKRVLRPNGSLYCFCATAMSAYIEIALAREFNVLSHIVWTKPNDPGYDGWKGKMRKESLRQWYGHSERIIFAEPACEGNLGRSPFARYLREQRKAAGLTAHQLTQITGAYGAVNHGGAVSNWETGRNIPSPEQYGKLCEAILATGRVSEMMAYQDVVRPFSVNADSEYTDIWTFPSVRPYKGKHPAEKPLALLQHAIAATTYAGDIVLDCFAGSGSTAMAAISLGRRSVSMEVDPRWAASIANHLILNEQLRGLSGDVIELPRNPLRKSGQPQLPLFRGERA